MASSSSGASWRSRPVASWRSRRASAGRTSPFDSGSMVNEGSSGGGGRSGFVRRRINFGKNERKEHATSHRRQSGADSISTPPRLQREVTREGQKANQSRRASRRARRADEVAHPR